MPTRAVYRLLGVFAVLASIGLAVYLSWVTRSPGAALPALVYLAATAVLVWSPSGHALPDRVALGLVLVSGAVTAMLVLSLSGDRGLAPLAFGTVFLLAAAALLVGSGVTAGGLPRVQAVLPVVAVALAGVVAVWRLVAESGDPSALWHGCLLLLAAVVFLAGRHAAGPGRFAVGAAVCALSVAVVYFLAVSAGGAVPVALGAVFVAALVGSLPAARSAEPVGSPTAER
ncbi:hypothetical protein [Actinokineospora pegani]|uniref:hypothetical protein n=1 Tax=Actinokineospora pegani TaxID=2654637 RepID=UPI0012EA820E|nr:hypothetical protein [Actinokineospora pegani]